MKTRSRKAGASKKTEAETKETTSSQLAPSVQDPPQVFVWPKDTSDDARVVTLQNPATSAPNRYLVCPEKGCFEFTRIAGPKRACRSWLLTPKGQEEESGREESQQDDEGYVLQTPDLLVATPLDPLFLVLPALSQDAPGGKQMFLPALDYIEKLEERSEHLKQMLRQDAAGRLEKMLEASMLSVCDTMEAGEEVLFKISNKKLLDRLLAKAGRMVDKGLPWSMEERFVKQALAVPVMTIRREESSISLADGENVAPGAETDSTSTSQETVSSATTAQTESTEATSFESVRTPPPTSNAEITHLLRLRTALNFVLSSYIPNAVRTTLTSLLASREGSPIDFTPLDDHLEHLAKLKQEAQALRSLSDNISRKRSAIDDDEALEKAEAKKRKKEDEEARKKNVTHGVKKLAKADRSGMKSISSFFGAKAGSKK